MKNSTYPPIFHKRLSWQQLRRLYGFHRMREFIIFIKSSPKELFIELVESGAMISNLINLADLEDGNWNLVQNGILPKHQKIFVKYWGFPTGKKTKPPEITKKYGLKNNDDLMIFINDEKGLRVKLEKTGWKENHNYYKPIQLRILDEYWQADENILYKPLSDITEFLRRTKSHKNQKKGKKMNNQKKNQPIHKKIEHSTIS